MSRLPARGGLVVVATVAAAIGAAGRAHAQATPGPRRVAPAAAAPSGSGDSDWDKHVSLGLELGPGGVITPYDQNQSPSSLLFYASLRANYDLNAQWSGGVTLRQWWLPGSNHATMYGVLARWEPVAYEFGRAFVDLSIGAASTTYAWSYGVDIGGGVEWDLPDAPGLSIGPFLRYNQVINPDNRNSNDGRAWAIGGSFTYHFGRAAAAAHPGAGPRRSSGAYRLSVPDSDHDGVGDDEDVCKNVPQGKHPDPFKPGCPENDEDGDDIPDVDDACPVTPPGPNPDPKRPGCPFIDTDKDGVADADDACPLKPGQPSADPAHNGCPMGRTGTPPQQEKEPAETPSEPSTVKKRHMK